MSKFLIIVSLVLLVFLATVTKSASAAGCTIVYGGGKTDCVGTTTPVPQATATPVPAPVTQTKGGLPIQPSTNPQTAPNTGPEVLGLIGLIPMAGAGLWFRKKTQLH